MINVPVLVLVDKLLAKVKMAIVLGARYALSAIWAKCSCLALSISFTCILFVVANMGLLCSSAFLILSFSLSNKDFPFLLFFSLFRFLFFIFFSLFRFPSFIVFSLFRFPSFIFFSLFRFPFGIWLANMGVVCIGWWALHTIMLSDALLQLRVLMLKKRGGRVVGVVGVPEMQMPCLISVRCTCVNILVRMLKFFSNFARQHKGAPRFVKMDCYHPFIGQQLETIEDLCQCRKDPRTSPCHCGCFRHSPSH